MQNRLLYRPEFYDHLYPPVPHACRATLEPPAPSLTPLTESEKRALQELADTHGSRWRAILWGAHQNSQLTGVLQRLMQRPDAGNKIARAAILPRSLPPVALYYGPVYF